MLELTFGEQVKIILSRKGMTIKENMEWLKITTNSEIIRIPTDEIIFIKGDGNYSDIFLANGKKENVISQLHDLMDKLTALNYSPFYRVGKSLIINRDYIFKVTLGRLDGEPLLEGLDVVAIVAQLTCGLHVE